MVSEINEIRAKAKNLGFSFVRFTDVEQSPHFHEYLDWLGRNQFGQMKFLNNSHVIESRRAPEQLLEGAKSIIVLGVNYSHPSSVINTELSDMGMIAAYAQYEDYHHVLKYKANELIESINNESAEKINYRIFIDSGPLMEKDFAFATGEGWIGRNSLFIHPEKGSFSFLCCIMVDQPLSDKTRSTRDLCGNCHLCEQACPTQCINGDHTINASRCISYLTIEHKGVIPKNLRTQMGNRVFGCDICQVVCPYNVRKTEKQNGKYFNLKNKQYHPVDLLSELTLSKESFTDKFKNTPILRLSYENYLRNIIIAAGNSQQTKFVNPLKMKLSKSSEILRLHAIWALGRIGSKKI